MNNDINKSKEQLIAELDELRKKNKAKEDKLKAANQQLDASHVKLKKSLIETLENMSDGFVSLDENWHYTYVNKKAGEILGRKPEDLVGKHIWTEFPEGIGQPVYKKYYKGVETQKAIYFEDYYQPWDRWFENRVFPSKKGLSIFFHDITERKQAEEALIASEARLKQAEKIAHLGHWEFDLINNVLIWSDEVFRIFDLKPQEFEATYEAFLDHIHPDDREKVNEAYTNSLKTKTNYEIEHRILLKNGEIKYVLEKCNTTYNDTGKPIRSIGTVLDITECKQAEKALRESEERFRKMFKNHAAIMLLINPESGAITDANSAAQVFYGYSHQELCALKIHDINQLSKEEVDKEMQNAKNEQRNYFIFPHKLKNGQIRTVEVRSSPIEINNKEMLFSIIQDITERKQAEEALRESEMKFRKLSESTRMGIGLYQNDYWIYANPAAEEITGYSFDELKHMKFWEFVAPEYVDLIKKRGIARQKGKPAPSGYEFKIITKQGKEKWVFLTGNSTELKSGKAGLISVIDITERKQNEKELTKLSTAVTQSPAVIEITDIDGNLEYLNPKFTEITGYSPEEALGQNPRFLKSGEHPAEMYEALWDTITSGNVWRGEFHNKKKNGELYWEMASISPIFDKKGNIINYIKVAEDITERKQAEDNFRNSIDESPLGIRIVNQAGKTIYVNKALLAIYEFSSLDEFNNTKAIDRYTGKSYREHQERKKIRQAGGDVSGYEISIRRKNGEIRHIKVWRKEVIWNREKHFQVINQDITELKRLNSDLIMAKEKAEESEYKIRSMFENTQIGILYCNTEGKILEVNQVILDILGSPSKEATLKINLLTFKPLQEVGFAQNVKKCISEKIVVTEDTVYTSKWGKTIFMKYHLIPVILNNKVIGVWANLNNLTDLWNIQNQLKKAKEKAEESDRLKTAFLHNMSHEIRTPLNGITGFISLLQDSEIDDKQKQEYFDIINKSSDRLIATVTDIIDISRIEAGEVEVTKTEVSVNEILEDQYKFFYQEAQSKGLELNYKPTLSDREAHVVTDKHKLEGILTNLIKNAIKYTERGEITFGCRLKAKEDNAFIEFYVKDTGIGIPADRIDAIFNPFEQADIEDTRAFQGSGLGLAIAKSYVEMLGGEISVKSKEGEGSTFTFSLPYTKPFEKESDAKENIKKEPKPSFSHLSLIIAEDDETNQLFYKTIFKNKFKKITYTATGKETIEKFRENPDTDIILMDIKMPDMNGYDATREIRKFNTDVVIIAQTAYGLSGDREKALEAGCDDYISKPFKREALFEKIRACLDKKGI